MRSPRAEGLLLESRSHFGLKPPTCPRPPALHPAPDTRPPSPAAAGAWPAGDSLLKQARRPPVGAEGLTRNLHRPRAQSGEGTPAGGGGHTLLYPRLPRCLMLAPANRPGHRPHRAASLVMRQMTANRWPGAEATLGSCGEGGRLRQGQRKAGLWEEGTLTSS